MCKVLCLNHIVSYYPYGEMLAPSFHKDFYLEVSGWLKISLFLIADILLMSGECL